MTSVREITPVNLPEIRDSGMADTDMAPGCVGRRDGDAGAAPIERVAGVDEGVAGAEGDGEAASTTHMR